MAHAPEELEIKEEPEDFPTEEVVQRVSLEVLEHLNGQLEFLSILELLKNIIGFEVHLDNGIGLSNKSWDAFIWNIIIRVLNKDPRDKLEKPSSNETGQECTHEKSWSGRLSKTWLYQWDEQIVLLFIFRVVLFNIKRSSNGYCSSLKWPEIHEVPLLFILDKQPEEILEPLFTENFQEISDGFLLVRNFGDIECSILNLFDWNFLRFWHFIVILI